ncbi:UvrD-helicase domain-containing protein [Herbaspirillum sp. CAH-3]|uniref:UvrD-helicase domain-containing protein n=1 Tax=Herbaspirillum sp. CAH-3 TaxID=2605746 RepID=UPI0012AC8765|nr:AAA family ATPase [Herbaspirillum sp. CAH-3]
MESEVTQVWGPSVIGRLLCFSPTWEINTQEKACQLSVNGRRQRMALSQFEDAKFTPGLFWTQIEIANSDGESFTLDGIPNLRANKLKIALGKSVAAIQHAAKIKWLIENFEEQIEPIKTWVIALRSAISDQLKRHGWLTTEFAKANEALKPDTLGNLLDAPEIKDYLNAHPEITRTHGLDTWGKPVSQVVAESNDAHLSNQLEAFKDFFDGVEKAPLTQEQRQAVICFDNRVLLVACAGSGKTSTMVAKVGYALLNRYLSPDRILLLAFNADAAAELRDRLDRRLSPFAVDVEGVKARTFHSFGLEVIGQATGKKPRLAPWLESARSDLEKLMSIVDTLKDQDQVFRTQWDMFRIVLAQDMPAFGKDEEVAESWDHVNGRPSFWTKNNEQVKSYGELLIADWLFYNGVKYQYEAPYEHDVADAHHGQYRPDFYFPDIDAYLEHWGVDQDGNPPESFKGYKESMEWKRRTHKEHETVLLETTTAGIADGQIFTYLTSELTRLGIHLDPNPDRPVKGRKPIENARLARTIRSFITHAKSNRLNVLGIRQRLDNEHGQFKFRHRLFLNLIDEIWKAWETELRSYQSIDFEDMLNKATDLIESGKWKSPYGLVMVDEFQDASHARAKLLAGLVKEPGKHLFAVGDDWQSINRFAGADISVMTNFQDGFGEHVTLKLEKTFRCVRSICDVSSAFVMKNPKQLRKLVTSIQDSPDASRREANEAMDNLFSVVSSSSEGIDHLQQKLAAATDSSDSAIRIICADKEDQIRDVVAIQLKRIADEYRAERTRPSVYVLGRYQKDRQFVPLDHFGLDVEFVTVHSAKGLEADHVFIPKMTSDILGFPSRVADDPVLRLAMPGGDDYPFAEERRLFYVALTRARKTVTLVTVSGKESLFITEMMKEYKVPLLKREGQVPNASEICPKCKIGLLSKLNGKYGPFIGCTRFPRCDFRRSYSEKRPAL